jgi:hypothetical protein
MKPQKTCVVNPAAAAARYWSSDWKRARRMAQ